MFSNSAPRLFALPPGADFGREVVAGLESRLHDQPPEAWANVTLFVNTRRMQRRIREVFDAGPPRLLPRLRLITDLALDPIGADLPPAISPLRRRLELSQLVGQLLDRQRSRPGEQDVGRRRGVESLEHLFVLGEVEAHPKSRVRQGELGHPCRPDRHALLARMLEQQDARAGRQYRDAVAKTRTGDRNARGARGLVFAHPRHERAAAPAAQRAGRSSVSKEPEVRAVHGAFRHGRTSVAVDRGSGASGGPRGPRLADGRASP